MPAVLYVPICDDSDAHYSYVGYPEGHDMKRGTFQAYYRAGAVLPDGKVELLGLDGSWREANNNWTYRLAP